MSAHALHALLVAVDQLRAYRMEIDMWLQAFLSEAYTFYVMAGAPFGDNDSGRDAWLKQIGEKLLIDGDMCVAENAEFFDWLVKKIEVLPFFYPE